MDPNTIRIALLQHLAEHDTTRGYYLSDEELVARTGVAMPDVQRQLEILEGEGLVQLLKTFGPTYAAVLTRKGMLAVEGLDRRDDAPPPPRRVGF